MSNHNSKSNKNSKVAPPVAAKPAPVAAKPTPVAAKPAPVAAKPAPKPLTKAQVPYEPTQEEVQTRAFEIFVSEGCKEGSDLENWLRAEKELRSR
jgi:hypothetical protein